MLLGRAPDVNFVSCCFHIPSEPNSSIDSGLSEQRDVKIRASYSISSSLEAASSKKVRGCRLHRSVWRRQFRCKSPSIGMCIAVEAQSIGIHVQKSDSTCTARFRRSCFSVLFRGIAQMFRSLMARLEKSRIGETNFLACLSTLHTCKHLPSSPDKLVRRPYPFSDNGDAILPSLDRLCMQQNSPLWLSAFLTAVVCTSTCRCARVPPHSMPTQLPYMDRTRLIHGFSLQSFCRSSQAQLPLC